YGSYLVNAAGGCNDCHTNPPYATGGDPFQGQPKQFNSAKYLGGGVAFGPITSRNITPDAQGRPAGHSLSDFVPLIPPGPHLDHLHTPKQLLQVMPWPVYQSLTDLDLAAIYSYLSAIPCLEGGPGAPANRCGH